MWAGEEVASPKGQRTIKGGKGATTISRGQDSSD